MNIRKKKYFRLFAAISLIIFSQSANCGNYTRVGKNSASTKNEIIKFPKLNDTIEIEVGETIIYTAIQTTINAIKLSKPLLGDVTVLWSTINVVIDTFPLEQTHSDNGALFYVSTSPVKIKGLSGWKVALRFPKHNSESYEICLYDNPDYFNCDKIPPLVNGVDYEETKTVKITGDSFKKELVYTGGNKNSVTLLYREFANDLARPAFSQELKYDISEDNTIGYKGARFEVIKANNTGLIFKTLKYLN